MEKKKLKILITAGSTMVMIDKVRSISNIFKGKTGTAIAKEFASSGAEVTLITSNPDLAGEDMKVIAYKTYDELYKVMEKEITTNSYDVIIHSAAVSDYQVEGAYMTNKKKLTKIDNSKKISSSFDDLYLRLIPTKKIVDLIREPWGFEGYLIKFKLQVGISDRELIEIAEKSRITSGADMIIANCLEWANSRAYIIMEQCNFSISRASLAETIVNFLKEELS